MHQITFGNYAWLLLSSIRACLSCLWYLVLSCYMFYGTIHLHVFMCYICFKSVPFFFSITMAFWLLLIGILLIFCFVHQIRCYRNYWEQDRECFGSCGSLTKFGSHRTFPGKFTSGWPLTYIKRLLQERMNPNIWINRETDRVIFRAAHCRYK